MKASLKCIAVVTLLLAIAVLETSLLSANRILAQEDPNGCSIRVDLNTITLGYNDHVGNKWSFYAAVNDEPWVAVSRYSTKTVFQQAFQVAAVDLKISAKAVEHDKYPDIGISSKNLQVQCPSSGESHQSLTIDVRVTEDRGRYAGHSAVWGFNFEIIAEAQRIEQPPSAQPPVTPVIPPSPRPQEEAPIRTGIFIQSIQPYGDDETVTIVNNSGMDVDMTGWRMESSNSLGQEVKETFWFPSGCIFPNGSILRIHSGPYARAWGDRSCGYSTIDLPWFTTPVWSDRGDVAWLRNSRGELMSLYAYR